jgi:iron complex transport system substrate-binding protein
MKPFAAFTLWVVLIVPSMAAQESAAPTARRIVTFAPHLTELVYTAGAGEHLVGTDSYSDYPPQANNLPRVGDAFQVDYERVLALRPDLVLVWSTGMPEPVIARLVDLGLRVERVSISRLEDIATALRRIGALAGTAPQAERAARKFLDEVRKLGVAGAGREPLTVFYQISEAPLYTVSGKHVISEMIELCGGRNVFAELEQLAPPVGLEAVIERDPQVIITADGAQGDPLSVWRRWPDVAAVRAGNLYTVSADRVARSTTRIVEGARQICAAIDSARRKAAAK